MSPCSPSAAAAEEDIPGQTALWAEVEEPANEDVIFCQMRNVKCVIIDEPSPRGGLSFPVAFLHFLRPALGSSRSALLLLLLLLVLLLR